jgi:hypothetical protein
MKSLIILYLLIISTIIVITSSSKSTVANNRNCLSSKPSSESKDLMNLYLKLPHGFVRHKNSAKALCMIEKYLNNKQNIINKISYKNNLPYKWNNKRKDFGWI